MCRRFDAAAIVVALVALAGCAGDPDEIGWVDVRSMENPLASGAVVAAVDDFSVVRGAEGVGAGSSSPCLQTVIDGIAGPCVDYAAGSGGFAARRLDDRRYIEVRYGADDVREFVVWSDRSPTGRSIAPLVADGERILYWPMEPGERPWGVQVVDGEGFAITTWSGTDLPAD
jgi:hypothetical protein